MKTLLERIKSDPDSHSESPVTRERIAQLEEEIGFRFPPEFVAFHVELGGGEYRFARMMSLEHRPQPPMPFALNLVHGRAKPAPGAHVVLVDLGSCELTQHLRILYDVTGDVPDALVPFGDDWGGNLYCFDGAGAVVQLDHEAPDEVPRLVGASFTEFIERNWGDDS